MFYRPSTERGHFQNSWLNARHSFSFGEYFDPEHMQFHDLRVINQDIVAPEGGFATHGHRDMEIITYVLRGEIAHKDSMGNERFLKAGEVQVMSAGRGVLHSEFNPSPKKELELLQIWITPEVKGGAPRYEEREFSADEKRGQLKLIVSGDGRADSLRIQQDAQIYASVLNEGGAVAAPVTTGRVAWLQVIRGQLDAQGQTLGPGDGLGIDDPKELKIKCLKGEAEFLLFDLKRRS